MDKENGDNDSEGKGSGPPGVPDPSAMLDAASLFGGKRLTTINNTTHTTHIRHHTTQDCIVVAILQLVQVFYTIQFKIQ